MRKEVAGQGLLQGNYPNGGGSMVKNIVIEKPQRRSMIVESSDQVPRATLLKRFPIPRNFGVSSKSRIERGKTWPAPAGATHVQTFEIYRYDPDFGANPRLDTFQVDLGDCGPMVLDALFWIKNKVDLPLPSAAHAVRVSAVPAR